MVSTTTNTINPSLAKQGSLTVRAVRGKGSLQGFPGECLPCLNAQLQQIHGGAALITGTCTAGASTGPAQLLTRRIHRSGFPGAPTRGCQLPGSARRWSPLSLPTLDRGWDSGNSPLASGERNGQIQHSKGSTVCSSLIRTTSDSYCGGRACFPFVIERHPWWANRSHSTFSW